MSALIISFTEAKARKRRQAKRQEHEARELQHKRQASELLHRLLGDDFPPGGHAA